MTTLAHKLRANCLSRRLTMMLRYGLNVLAALASFAFLAGVVIAL
jgi:hypothetical protein